MAQFHCIPLGACLNCGKTIDMAGCLSDNDKTPKPGSVMICLDCSHAMEWDGQKFVPLSDKAICEMAGDAEFLETMAFANFAQQMK